MNPAAIAATGATLAAHGVEGVRLVLTDLIAGLEAELRGGVDLLVAEYVLNDSYAPARACFWVGVGGGGC